LDAGRVVRAAQHTRPEARIMKRIVMYLVIAAMATTLASVAFAGTATPRVDRREARQHARIRQGVKSGQLTPSEAARLHAGQRHVNRVETRAKADGKVTPAERARLNRAQNHQSRAIARKKHNARTR
jgi:hypothetical protein